MNKLVYLGLSKQELSKTVMYDFWYEYVKSKYVGKEKLRYMGTDGFTVNIKTNDIYKNKNS